MEYDAKSMKTDKNRKNLYLFNKQKALLDEFLSHGAIDAAQYEKSLSCLEEKLLGADEK